MSKDTVVSSTTGRIYNPKDSIRIIDLRQQRLYLRHNLTLLDVYHSQKNGRIYVVMVFDKQESYPYYLQWQARTLNEPDDIEDEDGDV